MHVQNKERERERERERESTELDLKHLTPLGSEIFYPRSFEKRGSVPKFPPTPLLSCWLLPCLPAYLPCGV